MFYMLYVPTYTFTTTYLRTKSRLGILPWLKCYVGIISNTKPRKQLIVGI